MAHAQAAAGVKAAVRCGARSVEHGIDLDDEALELIVRSGCYLVPTLVAPEAVLSAADAGLPISHDMVGKAREVIERHRESFRRAVDAGVNIAMGTDSGISPHGDNLRELELMAANGLSPQDALRAATGAAAELMGLEGELGTIEPGKRADLLVVEGDPLELGSLRERIQAVYKDGVRVRPRSEPMLPGEPAPSSLPRPHVAIPL
jgi:imidazolonepropionase-like amidohydrolase